MRCNELNDVNYSVSMLDGHLFNTLAALAEHLRKKTNKPFGGIQVCVALQIEHCLIARSSWSLATFSNSHQCARERPSLPLKARLGSRA